MDESEINKLVTNTDILDIIDSLGFFIEIVDAEGKYVYCSKSNQSARFLSNENVIGRRVTDVYKLNKTENENKSILMRTMREGRSIKNFVWQYNASDGKKYFWLTDSAPIIKNNKQLGAICVGRSFRSVKEAVEKSAQITEADISITAPIVKENCFFKDIVYQSSSMQEAVEQARQIVSSSAPVLLLGETGTGKELFANSIHNESPKKNAPFVAINCGAIPETLLESTLFGTSKGSYTGAIEKKGLFEEARNGTIFLDEINSLNIDTQAKLLRVIEDKKLRRVGSNQEISISARIISAINADPFELIHNNKIRPDLFYRFAVTTIEIPPLRQRENDVMLLTRFFIKHCSLLYHKQVDQICEDIPKVFQEYSWPGNVRELKHIIEHAISIIDKQQTTLDMHHLPYYFLRQVGHINDSPVVTTSFVKIDYKSARNKYLSKCEHEFVCNTVKEALSVFNGNISKTARALNITRQHLYTLMREHQINNS
ncbi:MAG TPA: sigma 54-interacting transcriptional regulator [Clostridiales bacterium]|nr:sigma 54-interacting transcriptional regulator [Clostridiales bacterium]